MVQKQQPKFKILPHTADVRLMIFGSSFEEIFQNALLGMAQILKPQKASNVREIAYNIDINSLDPTALLIDFLSEVLYFSNVDHAVFENLVIERLTENSLKGKIIGYEVEGFGEDIKAVTYHEAYVSQKASNSWEALVIFDI
ncbi:MAG: archease [Candidatus Paceibacterota bacterium]|nr:archease [Candidatus Paceibacterota bacterium]HPD55566.1 archease [Candidatus Paceibacterota bacterium]HQM34949.1 archease [Candidatus Paceibacterota bacterium]